MRFNLDSVGALESALSRKRQIKFKPIPEATSQRFTDIEAGTRNTGFAPATPGGRVFTN